MRFDVEVAPGLHADIMQEPGNSSAIIVPTEISFSRQFQTQRLGAAGGTSRIFAGRLTEGVDLLEEVDGGLCAEAPAGHVPVCMP